MGSETPSVWGRLAVSVCVVFTVACADTTGPKATTTVQGTARVQTNMSGGHGTSLDFRSSPGFSSEMSVFQNGRLAASVAGAKMTLSDKGALQIGRRVHRLRTLSTDGSGAIEELEIRPRQFGQPSSRATYTRNGKVQAVVDAGYVRTAVGWELKTIKTTTYDEQGRLVNVSEVNISAGLRAAASLGRISRFLLPKTAEAMTAPVVASTEEEEGACGSEFRAMLLYVAAMGATGAMGNPLGFFVAAAGYANAMHEYAVCMEKNKTPEQPE